MAAKHKKKFRYVPEEIVENLLHRLPENSLLRFRCVSKQWRHSISRVKVPMQKVLTSNIGSNIPFTIIDETARMTKIDSRWVYESIGTGPRIVSLLGTWDGALLVSVDYDLFLWNPPKPPRHVLSISQWENLMETGLNCCFVITSGLCFDSVNGELKAVLAFPSHDGNKKVVVAVGLESKVVEIIDFPYYFVIMDYYNPCYYYSLRSGPVVNDKFHWFIHKTPSASHQHLLSFDPNDDVKFTDLPLPDGDFRIMGLGVLDGCLCVTCHNENVMNGNPIDVIAMKEYGVKESWEILFRMRSWYNYYNDLVPLFYTKNKNQVLFKGMGAIFKYNIKRRTRREIYILGLRYDSVIAYQGYLDQD